jgi:hypothetical protein
LGIHLTSAFSFGLKDPKTSSEIPRRVFFSPVFFLGIIFYSTTSLGSSSDSPGEVFSLGFLSSIVKIIHYLYSFSTILKHVEQGHLVFSLQDHIPRVI